jgi:hypothetical protein
MATVRRVMITRIDWRIMTSNGRALVTAVSRLCRNFEALNDTNDKHD